jgi:hypothetical protein
LNIVFDAFDNISGHRIVNILVQLPGGLAFYWKIFNTGEEQNTAENWKKLVRTFPGTCGCDNLPQNTIDVSCAVLLPQGIVVAAPKTYLISTYFNFLFNAIR